MSCPTHPLAEPCRTSPAAVNQVPTPVASAWEAEVGRRMNGDASHPWAARALSSTVPAGPPVSWRDRLGDHALLGAAAVATVALVTVGLTHPHWQREVGLVAAVALALLALFGGHVVMHARRRSRAQQFRAAQERVELSLRAQVADSEARHLRLAAFSELAAQVAHEVRNPLSAIVLNAELLEDELHACIHASPEVKRLARAVSAEAERLTELTNEYLTFARLPRPSSRRQPLSPLVEEAAHFSRSEAERGGVSVRLDLDPAAAAHVDERLFRQVLLNLLRNAVDAMPGGGTLTLRTEVGADRVSVDVLDTGPGVPPAVAEAIFEPFFSTKAHGTGLGLAVARKVARDHGGELRLLPSARGAWFRFELPLEAPPPAGTTHAPALEVGA